MDEILKALEKMCDDTETDCCHFTDSILNGDPSQTLRQNYDRELTEAAAKHEALIRAIAILTMSANEDLQALRDLDTNASAAPWSVEEGWTPEDERFCHIEGWADEGRGEWLALTRADADLIVAMRNRIRSLVEELVRSRAVIKAARDVVPFAEFLLKHDQVHAKPSGGDKLNAFLEAMGSDRPPIPPCGRCGGTREIRTVEHSPGGHPHTEIWPCPVCQREEWVRVRREQSDAR